MKQDALFTLIISLFAALLAAGCSDDRGPLPAAAATKLVGADALSYSGVIVLGAQRIPWTGQSGVLLFLVVRNTSDHDWQGHPEAAAYSISPDGSRGELIAAGKGVLTTLVDREQLTPTNELSRVPANEERESLTFVPVDFSENPLVYVYWRFVDGDERAFSFKTTIRNPGVQRLLSISEARVLLGR